MPADAQAVASVDSASQVDSDAALAAQMQRDEQHGKGAMLTSADPSPVLNDRSDRHMKELLRALPTPHHVQQSRTHDESNCLIYSILLALIDQGCVRPLDLKERRAICSAIRLHLIEHHGVEPPARDGGHSFLSHEDHFKAIGDQLRDVHSEVWLPHVDCSKLSIAAVVFDRFHRRQLFNDVGEFSGELPETHPPVFSPAPQAEQGHEVLIQLYCNTADDGHGTPYHYEWLTARPQCDTDDDDSDADSEDSSSDWDSE